MFDGNSCGVLSAIHEQSPDINQGVDRNNKEEQGAGDQGMMFGYATDETENYMPLALELSHLLLIEQSDVCVLRYGRLGLGSPDLCPGGHRHPGNAGNNYGWPFLLETPKSSDAF